MLQLVLKLEVVRMAGTMLRVVDLRPMADDQQGRLAGVQSGIVAQFTLPTPEAQHR
jgi:hypothetical protein